MESEGGVIVGAIIGLIVLYEIIKPKRLKIKVSLKVKAGKSSNDRKSGG